MLVNMKVLLIFLALILTANTLGQQVGDVAPTFTVINQVNEVVNLNDLIGTPLIVNTWATWCPPCREELPLFEKVFKEVNEPSEVVASEPRILLVSNESLESDTKLNILLINNAEAADKAINYLAENSITLPSGVNPTSEQKKHWQEQGIKLEETLDVIRLYRVRGMPTTFYIDAQGIIRVVKTGLITESSMIKDLRSIGIKWIP